ncbi:MAG TPA: class I SAM-dependent methyltransferase [Candidatus Acidoferrales bacterium]|jgi:SAM-dependent methyltransferase|nr:class I SAM-dependent methyltransferase [Candidatus Acidoferrales bacterium]
MQSTEPVTFYDQHPFDWVSPDGSMAIDAVVSRPLLELIQNLDPNSLVLDIGCGAGRVLGVLARRAIRCVGLDRSRVSVGMIAQRYHRPGVVGDNLRLPFADGTADVVISDGVIHHTDDPAAAFAENCRILKTAGRMYLAVYKPYGRYPWLYKYPGAAIRSGLRHQWAEPLIVLFAQVPYFLVHFVRAKGRRTWAGARNLFFDYFVTPRVAFLPRTVVEEWCAKQGVRVVLYDENRGGNIHSFCLAKEAHPSAAPDSPKSFAAEVAATLNRQTA